MNRYVFVMFSVCIFVLQGNLIAQSLKSDVRKQSIDFDWRFSLGENPGAEQVSFSDEKWRKLDLPHDWSIEGPPEHDNPTSVAGGYFPSGIGWYRKSINIPSDWKTKKVGIYFEGVYMNSEVFINGKSLGVYPYGYSSFFYDLSGYLKFGEQNVVAVKVDNSQQNNCRWYSGSGIYRHVWLIATNDVHVDHWGVSITTPEVSTEKAKVVIETLVKNESEKQQKITVTSDIVFKGEIIRSKGSKVTIGANSESKILQEILVDDPKLWSPEIPNLYQASISITNGKSKLDTYDEQFGIRSIAFSTEQGFQLNGETVLLNGGCVHHDNGCLGAAAFDRAEERRVELLKSGGFNAVRTSHNPPSEAFLEACDRLGLLVIDEAFDGWRTQKVPFDYSLYFDEWWQKDLDAMVLRDRNHPSIIMWSTGNEVIERTEDQAIKTGDMLASRVREIDPTRPVTSAMTTWGQGWVRFDSLFSVHDIGGYNYQLLKYSDFDHERVPSRIMVQTESYPINAFPVWNKVNTKSYIIGDFVWTALDYLGESSIGRYYYPGEVHGEHWEGDFWPWHGAYCGDIDIIGWRKPISHYRNMLYNDDEKLYMAVREPNPKDGKIRLTEWAVWPTWESWNWPGYEDQVITVEVISKYPTVRLYLNDQLIGEKPTTMDEEFKALFDVRYNSGELKAVGVEDGREIETYTLNTAGQASKIQLNPDRTSIKADGQDLLFVSVEITDENGRINSNADHDLNFQLEGPATIVGVANANLKSVEPYVGTSKRAWKGRALVVIRSTRTAGDITLVAQSDGLTQSVLKISSDDIQ
ncbi:sugar-binding domain-containing protein [Marinoscillum sp. MHG1-6]|uniref:sugar-binding domain-containing protein n=1 Tax=Marinoscillum sp. MHG1-6 TaxID=2959627 RepID=UPI0021586A1C|nr:sugar-binding domain-containing protein [Marinoscillum sp. MHG1-6]